MTGWLTFGAIWIAALAVGLVLARLGDRSDGVLPRIVSYLGVAWAAIVIGTAGAATIAIGYLAYEDAVPYLPALDGRDITNVLLAAILATLWIKKR